MKIMIISSTIISTALLVFAAIGTSIVRLTEQLIYFTTFVVLVSKINTFVPLLSVLCNTNSTGSFYSKVRITKNNTPSMPLSDAHLEGFFILTPPHV